MKTFKTYSQSLICSFVLALGLTTQSYAFVPVSPRLDINTAGDIITVGGNCYAIGQKLAKSNGGQLASARAAKGEKCVVVVLIPGAKGERPRRKEITVPAK